MTTTAIREQLKNYLQVADEKKVKAIYALVEDDIKNDDFEYPEALKTQLDAIEEDYNKGDVKFYTEKEIRAETRKLLKSLQKK
ncbi:hypothetical protein [Parafilimonas sp.]|uniref:hypothetical protein n=1 Tax=Parafilimonas sp. TaxID=1969739 RepID=UPI0039E4853A